MRVGRRYTFNANHSLPDLDHPWNKPHEHVYTIEVEGEGNPPYAVDMEGWDEKGDWMVAINKGEDMNELVNPSTVENLAQFFLKDFPNATALTVWEDGDRWARAER